MQTSTATITPICEKFQPEIGMPTEWAKRAQADVGMTPCCAAPGPRNTQASLLATVDARPHLPESSNLKT
jgi:hypothetical protein